MRVVALVLVLVVLAPSLVVAQHGGGRGLGRGGGGKGDRSGGDRSGEQSGTEKGAGDKRGQRARDDAELVGKYSLNRHDVLQAVERGEGRQALEAYEKAAADAEQSGALVLAVRAGAAAVLVASRLNQTQKVLALGPHTIELGKKAPQEREVVRAVLGTASLLARSYRVVNDAPKARAVLEDATTYSRSPAVVANRRALTGVLASVLEALALTEAAQGDRDGALAHLREAVQITDEGLGERMKERQRLYMRRNVAQAYLHIALVSINARQFDAAAAALAKAAELARTIGMAEVSADVALHSANLALTRGDGAEALRFATS
jgi:tetratricopeptide (TPR) repeat protein